MSELHLGLERARGKCTCARITCRNKCGRGAAKGDPNLPEKARGISQGSLLCCDDVLTMECRVIVRYGRMLYGRS